MWVSFRQNNHNCPVESFITPISQDVLKVYIGGLIWGTCVVDENGNVYVGSTNRKFVCIDKNCDVIWSLKLQPVNDSLIDSAAAIHPKGFVVVPGGDGHIYAVDKTTGKYVWIRNNKEDISDEMHKSGVIVNSFEGNIQIDLDGNIYAGCDNDFMYCLHSNGKIKWKYKTNMMIWTCSVVTEKYCYFGSLDCFIYACDKNTGKLLAKYNTHSEIKSSPVFYKNKLFVCNTDGNVMCFTEDLKLLWKIDIGRNIYATPITWDDTIICCTMNGDIYSLSVSSKKIIWKLSLYTNICSSPLVINNQLIVATNLCKLVAIDIKTSNISGCVVLNNKSSKRAINASLVLDKYGRIIVGSYDGFIYYVPCNFYEKSQLNSVRSIAELRNNQNIYFELQNNNQHIITLRFIYYGLQNAAICLNSVSITPKIPYKYVVSSDGSFINLIPRCFSYLDNDYNIKISALFYLQSNNWVLDRFLSSRGKITQHIKFSSPKTQSINYLVKEIELGNFYILQPTVVDTYIPAAMDAQGFKLVFHNRKVKYMPALPDFEDGFIIYPNDKRTFITNFKIYKNVIVISGSFSFSAMGGTIFSKNCLKFVELLPDKSVKGEFYGSTNCLSIKGNGKNYKFSSDIINQLFDPFLNLHYIGICSGRCSETS